MECLRHVVGLAVFRSIRHRNRWVEIIVERGHAIDLRQQLSPVLRDGVFTLTDLIALATKGEIVLYAGPQAFLVEGQDLLGIRE